VLQALTTELWFALADGDVWFAIGLALILFIACLAFGFWLARFVGLLDAHAPVAETIGVGLGAGLITLSSCWAAIGSGGRSAFTPVAFGFAISIALAAIGHVRNKAPVLHPAQARGSVPQIPTRHWMRIAIAVFCAAAFIAAVALLYTLTMVPSPRNGVQPVTIMDTAFYSSLGADIAQTGTESILSPSGFVGIPGLPTQNWYHWGEIWLAGGIVRFLGVAPLAARHFIVLPMLLLAAATLTGTLVRRLNSTTSLAAFCVGFVACVFLAPVPLIVGPFFSTWAVGLVFGITQYGLAAVAVPFAVYAVIAGGRRDASWALNAFVGCAIAYVLPAHVVIAALAGVLAATVMGIRFLRSRLLDRSVVVLAPALRRTLVWAITLVLITIGWGLVTGHGIPATAVSPRIASFNDSWQSSVLIVALGAGSFYAIAAAGFLARRGSSGQIDLYVAATVVLFLGAIVWGVRLGDFNMFHVFFGAVAVFGVLAAAVGMWSLWQGLRSNGHSLFAIVVGTLFVLQLQAGALFALLRLQIFGAHDFQPVPVALVEAIRGLPVDAKVAYSCVSTEEVSYWDPRLGAIGVLGGRRIVPMCFEADVLSSMVGAELSAEVESPLFQTAPQRILYPTASSKPSSNAVTTFLRSHGIDYVYADEAHPNTLVPGAIPVMTAGAFGLLRIP
jgi:hypothetical protein